MMFTPLESIIGAILIQFATTSHIQNSGKVIGFSSLIRNFFFAKPNLDNLPVILGLVLASLLVAFKLDDFSPVYDLITTIDSSTNENFTSNSTYLAISAGLLVGLGTKYGCGCTSGHFLAGVSRLRKRSIIATAIFVSFGIITVKLLGNGPNCYSQTNKNYEGNVLEVVNCYNYDNNFPIFQENRTVLLFIVTGGFLSSYIILPAVFRLLKSLKSSKPTTSDDWATKLAKFIDGLHAGFLFGLGLFISGMVSPSKTLGFLSILTPSKFDPSLVMIALFAIFPNIFIWRKTIPQYISELKIRKPSLAQSFRLNFENELGAKFILGNALFGIGWGLYGVCPGPGFIGALGFNKINGVLWLASFLVGSKLANSFN